MQETNRDKALIGAKFNIAIQQMTTHHSNSTVPGPGSSSTSYPSACNQETRV